MRQLLSDGIDDYLVLRGSQDFSKRTLANERGVLKRFLGVNGNIWMHSIEAAHVTRHFENASRTRASGSLQLDHTVLGQFLEWGRHTRRMALDVDPMMGRRRPKTRLKERDRIHVSRFGHLLDCAGRRDPRDRAAVAVLLYTLIRDQEAADLRISDVDLDGGWLRVRITKSYQEDRMPISIELDRELRQWLTAYAAAARRALEPGDFLLPRRQSVGIIRAGVQGRIEGHEMIYVPEKKIARLGRLVGHALHEAGFPMTDDQGKTKMEGAHTIRRSGARALFDRLAADGYDHSLRIVQSMLHHSSVSITEKYIGVTADRRSRDEILRGVEMFPVDTAKVVSIAT